MDKHLFNPSAVIRGLRSILSMKKCLCLKASKRQYSPSSSILHNSRVIHFILEWISAELRRGMALLRSLDDKVRSRRLHMRTRSEHENYRYENQSK